MRSFVALAALTLAACGQTDTPPPAPEPAPPAPQVQAAPWFICDGLNVPTLLLFSAQENGKTRVTAFEKPSGASAFSADVDIGQAEGAAGSVYTPLTIAGVEAGSVREVNPGMLETPAVAYTRPVTSVNFRGADVQCRWLPRTRLMGFTGRRSIVIAEDADGDLIYTSYNFTDAASSPPIELSQNGRSTRFSAEVRDGQEQVGPNGGEFRFTTSDGYAYALTANRDGTGRIDVTRNGQSVQSEPLTAFVLGDAAAAAQ